MNRIIHVHITDDHTGELLADIDASSVPDGLAYYLRSRHIVPEATEASVARDARVPATSTRPIIFEQRDPISRNLHLALAAKVGP